MANDQQPVKLTPEQQKEMMESFAKRTKEIDEKVQYLCEKYKLGLSAVPMITPDGRVVAQPIWIDATQKQVEQKVEPKKNDLSEG